MFFHWPVQWVFRQAAKHDTQWFSIYLEALQLPTVFEAYHYTGKAERLAFPIIFQFPRWTP
jgi:hypothetical protein